METQTIILIVVGGVVFSLVSFIVGVTAMKRRTAAVTEYGRSRGLAPEADSAQVMAWMQGFKVLQRGSLVRLNNVLRGARDRAALALGDLTYTWRA